MLQKKCANVSHSLPLTLPLLRFFTLVETNQPSGENHNKITPGALADEGLKVGRDGSLTKNAWNLVRNMTKQRYEVARVWLKIASLAESRSKAGLGVKPSLISNLRDKHGTQVWRYLYARVLCTDHVCTSLYTRANIESADKGKL